MRILIRSVNWLGDAVLTLPAVRAVARLYPDAAISVLVKPSLASLFFMVPEVGEIIPLSGGRLKVARELRRRFDLSIILPNSFDSAFIPFLARIPKRVGYRTDCRGALLSTAVPRYPDAGRTHQVYHYLSLVDALGGPAASGNFADDAPLIAPPPDAMDWAKDFLGDAGFETGELVGIHAGATYGPAKRWFPERFVEASRRLKAGGAQIIFFGGPDEADHVTEIVRQVEGAVNAAGKTDLVRLAALLKRCRVVLTNDTGPMHLCAAVGTPVVALFGSTNPVTTGPFGDIHQVIRHPVSCSPCLLRECNRLDTPMECFDLIGVDEVVEAVEKYLGQT